MCGWGEAGVCAGCGRWQLQSGGSSSLTQSVWRTAEGAERRTGTGICTTYTHAQDHNRATERQNRISMELWGGPGPAPRTSPFDLFIYRIWELFSPNMETTGFCWLLLAAHFILLCQQGKIHSCLTRKSALKFGFYRFSTCCAQLLGDCAGEPGGDPSQTHNRGPRVCVCVCNFVRNRNICFV